MGAETCSGYLLHVAWLQRRADEPSPVLRPPAPPRLHVRKLWPVLWRESGQPGFAAGLSGARMRVAGGHGQDRRRATAGPTGPQTDPSAA